MKHINLLEDGMDELRDDSKEQSNRHVNGDLQQNDEDQSQRVSIPRGERDDEMQGGEQMSVRPQKSPFARGPSIGFIVFLLIITALVTAYYIFIREPKEQPPTPVPEEQSVIMEVHSAPSSHWYLRSDFIPWEGSVS